MNKEVEIERKYLIKGKEFLVEYRNQAYPLLNSKAYYFNILDNRETRVRHSSFIDKNVNLYFLGFKSTNLGIKRSEEEFEISKDLFDSFVVKNLISDRILRPVEKLRYICNYISPYTGDRHVLEIDNFYNIEEEIYLMEIEFNSEESAKNFRPCGTLESFIIKEVSGNLDYRNKNIFNRINNLI